MDRRYGQEADEKNYKKNILPAARFDAFDFDSVLWACYLCAGRKKCESGRFVRFVFFVRICAYYNSDRNYRRCPFCAAGDRQASAGEEGARYSGGRQIMTASTGAGISILVLGMAVYMIVWSTRQLKCDNREKEA